MLYKNILRHAWNVVGITVNCSRTAKTRQALTFKGRMFDIYDAAYSLQWTKVQYN
jgi:hypothetical protein